MRVRPKEWADRYLQFVGRGELERETPAPVAIWQDGRGISSREAAPYAMFAHTVANPTATQHWVYTWTPTNASRLLIVRLNWMRLIRENATSIVGLQVAAPIAKAATNQVILVGDAVPVTVTANEITNANLPAISVVNFLPDNDPPTFPYPEYFLEAAIPPGSVLEIISRVADDTLHMSAGFHTLPVV